MDSIKLFQGIAQVHFVASTVIIFLIKGKYNNRQSQLDFLNYYVSDVLHVSAVQEHHLVVLFTKLCRKSHVTQCDKKVEISFFDEKLEFRYVVVFLMLFLPKRGITCC